MVNSNFKETDCNFNIGKEANRLHVLCSLWPEKLIVDLIQKKRRILSYRTTSFDNLKLLTSNHIYYQGKAHHYRLDDPHQRDFGSSAEGLKRELTHK